MLWRVLLVVIGVGLVFYEGLPIGPLRYIPFAGKYLAMIVDGRVDREREAGAESVRAEARTIALALIEKRNDDNAEISDLDRAHLCVELGGRWVPNEDRCD